MNPKERVKQTVLSKIDDNVFIVWIGMFRRISISIDATNRSSLERPQFLKLNRNPTVQPRQLEEYDGRVWTCVQCIQQTQKYQPPAFIIIIIIN
jgi:hypothetical protein